MEQRFFRLAWHAVNDASAAEEIAQDAWVAIARSMHRLKDADCFPAWAFSIVNRRSVDWVRKQQRERIRKQRVSAESENFSHSVSTTSERSVKLSEAIQQLPADDQKLLNLFYETGMTVREIAQILDIPQGTVKSRLFKLRDTLKQYLER